MSLRRQIQSLILIAVVPALFLLPYFEYRSYQERKAEAQKAALRLAQYISDELTRLVDGNRYVMTALAQHPVVRAAVNPDCNQFFMNVGKQYPEYFGFGVLDRSGRLVCSSTVNTVGMDFSGRPSFKAAKRSDDFVISTYIVGRNTGKPALPIALPLKDATGAFGGVLLSALNLDWLARHMERKQQELPPHGVISIVDREGTVLVRVPPIESAKPGEKIRADLNYLLTEERPVLGEDVGLDRVPRLFAALPPRVTPHGLYVAVSIGKSEVLQPAYLSAAQHALVILIGVGLAVLAARRWAEQRLERPIARLVKATKNWREGRFQEKLGSGANRELRELAAAFDDMALRFLEQRQELQQTLDSRDKALQDQKLLTHELNHRVKNTLAMCQAIAYQSLTGSGAAPEALKSFNARLIALGKAHDVLTRRSWESADLQEVVRTATAAHCGADGSRIKADGPAVQLSPKTALALSMALHELCTNAAKYGALSNDQGQVAIRWEVERPGLLRFHWQEKGGPKVTAPTRRGFGSRLLRASFAEEGGEVRLEFPPDGVTCTITLPLAETGAALRSHLAAAAQSREERA